MKTRITALFLSSIFLLVACGGVTPYPNSVAASPAVTVRAATAFPTLTNTPSPVPTLWTSPTPETLSGYPAARAAVLPTCNPIDCLKMDDNVQRQDFTFHDLYLRKYVLRNWCNIDPKLGSFEYCAVTISTKGSRQMIEIWGYPTELGQETGADLTGRGIPDIVIVHWSSGNCCVRAIVYEAGDRLEKIMEVSSHWLGTFTDLNGDGAYEYVAMDRVWSQFCKDCAVWPTVVYEFRPERSAYLRATPKFQEVLSADIVTVSDFLDQFTERNPNIPFYFATDAESEARYWQYAKGNWDYKRAVNAVYQLASFYLLAGERAKAQEILNKYFPPGKAAEYFSGIEKDLQGFLAP